MVARVPFPFLKPSAFEEHSEDVALIYRDKWIAEASGEIDWMLHCIGENDTRRMIVAALVRSFHLAAMQLEARHGRSAVALGNEQEAKA